MMFIFPAPLRMTAAQINYYNFGLVPPFWHLALEETQVDGGAYPNYASAPILVETLLFSVLFALIP